MIVLKLLAERKISMLEVFKSKMMVLFMIIVIGVIYIDCSLNNNLEQNISNNELVAINK